MSENGADVSWNDVGKVLEDERSSVEDIQTDLARNNKGNICQSIDNCMTVFQEPNNSLNTGRSLGVEMISTSRMPANINVESG